MASLCSACTRTGLADNERLMGAGVAGARLMGDSCCSLASSYTRKQNVVI